MRPRSGATGDSLKEAIAINQSLSCLGTVINALTDQHVQAHIPYRSSKLTHLLEDSLGGNSHTVMLAACSPSPKSYFETLSTLQYAARAKLIICNPKVHKHEEERKQRSFDYGGVAGGSPRRSSASSLPPSRYHSGEPLTSNGSDPALAAARSGGGGGGGGGAMRAHHGRSLTSFSGYGEMLSRSTSWLQPMAGGTE